jgi:hypothetical protein
MRLIHAEGSGGFSGGLSWPECFFLDQFSDRTQSALGLWLGSSAIQGKKKQETPGDPNGSTLRPTTFLKVRFWAKLKTSTTHNFGYQNRKSGVDSESVRKTLGSNPFVFHHTTFLAYHPLDFVVDYPQGLHSCSLSVCGGLSAANYFLHS